jgi:hypothetical protein
MRRYLLSFLLGGVAATMLFLTVLSLIEIPEYAVIYRVEPRECVQDRYI